jgi:hypothetical protein
VYVLAVRPACVGGNTMTAADDTPDVRTARRSPRPRLTCGGRSYATLGEEATSIAPEFRKEHRFSLGARTGRVCASRRAQSASAEAGSGPCSASKEVFTVAKASRARSSVAWSCVAITLVRSSAPPGGTAGCIAVFTKTPAS